MPKTILISSLVWLGAATPVFGAETIIGRWCDRLLPNLGSKYNIEITIKANSKGAVNAHVRFGDTYKREIWPLTEQSGRVFLMTESTDGDRYRIVESTGELQLIDDDGLIRVAKRLEIVPQQGDCLK